MTFVGVDQDHQVVSEPRIFDIGVLAVACDFPRSLQHFVHLIEVEITEQGREVGNVPYADHERVWVAVNQGQIEWSCSAVRIPSGGTMSSASSKRGGPN